MGGLIKSQWPLWGVPTWTGINVLFLTWLSVVVFLGRGPYNVALVFR